MISYLAPTIGNIAIGLFGVALFAALVGIGFAVFYREAHGRDRKSITDALFSVLFGVLGLAGLLLMKDDPNIQLISGTKTVDGVIAGSDLALLLQQAEDGWVMENGHIITYPSQNDQMEIIEWL